MIFDQHLADSSTGAAALGGWLGIPSGITAEVMAQSDFDYLCIDMQHGLAGYSDAVAMLQAITTGTATPVVRVPWNEPGIIGRMLDSGAMAIIIPMVNSPAEAEAAVSACRYPPQGGRSHGPVRVRPVEGPDYVAEANSAVSVIVMIETAQAVESLDEILSVPGIDGVYVGPADLAISMGLPVGSDAPEFIATLSHIVERCNHHGVVPGIHASAALRADRSALGFAMITVVSDLVTLRSAVSAEVAEARGETAEKGSSLY